MFNFFNKVILLKPNGKEMANKILTDYKSKQVSSIPINIHNYTINYGIKHLVYDDLDKEIAGVYKNNMIIVNSKYVNDKNHIVRYICSLVFGQFLFNKEANKQEDIIIPVDYIDNYDLIDKELIDFVIYFLTNGDTGFDDILKQGITNVKKLSNLFGIPFSLIKYIAMKKGYSFKND